MTFDELKNVQHTLKVANIYTNLIEYYMAFDESSIMDVDKVTPRITVGFNIDMIILREQTHYIIRSIISDDGEFLGGLLYKIVIV